MKRPNWKLYYKMNRIGLWFILLCFVGVFILFLFLYDSTYPVFKYSLLYISIIAYSILIASTLGLIIIIKSWKNKSLSTLSNHRKILYSLSFLLLSFLILSSIEYLIYINDKDKFNIENNYVTTSTRDKMLNITKEIKCYKKYVEKYNRIYEELKNKEYLGYTNTDDLYFTVINGDTIDIKVNEKKPFPGTGTNGVYIKGINNAEDIGILLKNESYNISHPTSKVILKSIQKNDSINGNDFRLLVHQKIEKYQNVINEYNTILENELTISFGDFIIYNIFNSNITGNKTHIFIRLIFLLQAIIITFFSGYIYQTLYKMLDGEEKYIKIQNMKDKENSKKNKTFTRDFWWYLSIFITFIFIICCFPALFTQPGRLDFSNTGEIGDTIGGIMGPFVAIAAAILTFLAFWVQFKANEQQRKDIAKERFESKFYELLHLHKENLLELESDGKKGRQVMIQFCNYVSILYSLIDGFFFRYYASDIKVLDNYKNIVEKYKDERYLFIDISYNIFFYGEEVTNRLKDEELNLYKKVFELIHEVCSFKKEMSEQEIFLLCNDINDAPNIYFSRNREHDGLPDNGKLCYPSDLLKGHNLTLGLYFRQLYHIVKMVATSQLIIDEKEKYEYVKILRTQLSDYEQVLLYYNSLTNVGKKWNKPNQTQSSSNKEYSWIESMALIPRFRLIKNVPPSYKFIGITPEEVYKDEIELYNKHNIKFFELK